MRVLTFAPGRAPRAVDLASPTSGGPVEIVAGPATTLLFRGAGVERRDPHGYRWRRLDTPVPIITSPIAPNGDVDGPSFWDGNALVLVGRRIGVLPRGSSAWAVSPPFPMASTMVGRARDGRFVALGFGSGALVSSSWRPGRSAWTPARRVSFLAGATLAVRTGAVRAVSRGGLVFVWSRCVAPGCARSRIETIVRSGAGTWSPARLVANARGFDSSSPILTGVMRPRALVIAWLDAAPLPAGAVGSGSLRVAVLAANGVFTTRANRYRPLLAGLSVPPTTIGVSRRGDVSVAFLDTRRGADAIGVSDSR